MAEQPPGTALIAHVKKKTCEGSRTARKYLEAPRNGFVEKQAVRGRYEAGTIWPKTSDSEGD
jgi:hypothetical protein